MSSGNDERAIRYAWDPESQKWEASEIVVRITKEAIGVGGMRRAYKAYEIVDGEDLVPAVVKHYRREVADFKPQDYFKEVMTQTIAETYAQDFNKRDPPFKVSFVPIYVVKLAQRPDKPLVFFEYLLHGKYLKFNDNAGRVLLQDETAACFSHFTYVNSNNTLIVVDIQGVVDGGHASYTDPQIHTIDGSLFAAGNLGQQGIRRFLQTHRCGSVCKRLGLPHVEPSAPVAVSGAVPGRHMQMVVQMGPGGVPMLIQHPHAAPSGHVAAPGGAMLMGSGPGMGMMPDMHRMMADMMMGGPFVHAPGGHAARPVVLDRHSGAVPAVQRANPAQRAAPAARGPLTPPRMTRPHHVDADAAAALQEQRDLERAIQQSLVQM